MTRKIVNQAAIVFTLFNDGCMELRSIGENGNNDAEEFTDACMRAVGHVLDASGNFTTTELGDGDQSEGTEA